MPAGSTLHAYARHGSTSHGPLSPERLAAILRGAEPEGPEAARVRQALLETPAAALGPLAAEIGLSVSAIEQRLAALCGLDIAGLDRLQNDA